MALPNLRVEAAFGSGYSTPEADRVWYDLTTRVQGDPGISIRRGRNKLQETAQPSVFTAQLENNDGALTPNRAASPFYPNVKRSTPLRCTYRETSSVDSANLLGANQASMETSIADWFAGGSVPPTLSWSTTHADVGTHALLITWGTGGVLPSAQTTVTGLTGLTVGRQYTARARVWVPAGHPDVQLAVAGIGVGATTATKNTFATISITFTATAATHALQVWPGSAPTAGQQCWVDSVSVVVPYTASGNLLTPNQASFEVDTSDWAVDGLGTVATLVTGSFRSVHGTNSMRLTWPTSAASKFATTIVSGLVIGRTYTLSAYFWVTAGTPAVRIGMVAASANSPSTTTTGAFQRVSVTFVATVAVDTVVIGQPNTTTAGQQVWVDAIQLDEGDALGTFTTTPPNITDRFTGYVNRWPISWPRSADNEAVCSITATSRRARMGKTAKLKAPFRAAVLDADPEVYWPMDEVGVTDRGGHYAFRDITNDPSLPSETESIIAFVADTSVVSIYIQDGTDGPTDEPSLVKLKATTDAANPDWQHYLGGSRSMKFGTNLAGVGASFVMLARVQPTLRGSDSVDLARLFTGDNTYSDEVRFGLANTGLDRYLYVEADRRDISGNLVESTTWSFATTHEANQALYDLATDGQIHCYELDIAAFNAAVYIDGIFAGLTSTLGTALNGPFRSIAMAPRTLFSDVWIGHAAGYDAVLSIDATIALAIAGSATSETVGQRVTRIAGYLGVPAAEIDGDVGVAAPLGPQAEKDQSGVDVLEAAMKSTSGIMFDGRDGHLVVHARNRRWNPAALFTVSTAADEIEGNLGTDDGDSEPINSVEVSRIGSTSVAIRLTDDASISDHGLGSQSYQVVSSEDQEAEAFAYDVLARNAQPIDSFPTVTIDIGDLTPTQRAAVLAAEISDMFTAAGLPSQAADASEDLFIEGYVETASTAGHKVAFNTTTAAYDSPIFIPDDPVFGVLDVGNRIPF